MRRALRAVMREKWWPSKPLYFLVLCTHALCRVATDSRRPRSVEILMAGVAGVTDQSGRGVGRLGHGLPGWHTDIIPGSACGVYGTDRASLQRASARADCVRYAGREIQTAYRVRRRIPAGESTPRQPGGPRCCGVPLTGWPSRTDNGRRICMRQRWQAVVVLSPWPGSGTAPTHILDRPPHCPPCGYG